MGVFEKKEGISEGTAESLGCETESGASLDTEREVALKFWLISGEGEDLNGTDIVAEVGSVPFK